MELQTETKILEEKERFARIAIEPLERGFGHTLGTALRRVLLSSIAGAAITSVKIGGVSHEFSSLAGIKEDMVELLLNLKKINFQMTTTQPLIANLSAQGPKEVKAGDIACPNGLEVVNKELPIATLADKRTKLECEMMVEYGQGYRLPQDAGVTLGTILLDANFSPVKRVNYQVESTRLGRVTDLDRLVLEIWTNQALTPLQALAQSAAILVEEFSKIKGDTKLVKPEETKKESKKVYEKKASEGKVYLEELNLPTRTLNSLKKGNLETLDDVKAAGEEGLSKIKNVGPKTIQAILEKIKKYEKKG